MGFKEGGQKIFVVGGGKGAGENLPYSRNFIVCGGGKFGKFLFEFPFQGKKMKRSKVTKT